MPGRLINRDNDFGMLTRRIGTSDVPEVRRKRHLQALLFALARLHFAARRLLQPAGCQLSGHHIQPAPPHNTPDPCYPMSPRWGDSPSPPAWPVTSAPTESGL